MRPDILRSFLLSIPLITTALVRAQGGVGINNPTPHASALLDLTSSNKGLLTPRMTTALRTAIAAPATGLLVFDTTVGSFYYYNGTAWLMLTSGAAGWALNGNAGTDPVFNFLGTLDLVPLNFRIGMVRAGRLDFTSTTYGWMSGGAAMTGTQNSCFGQNAGSVLGTGMGNTFVGFNSGAATTAGTENTFVGSMAGQTNLLGFNNTFLGAGAGRSTFNGANNTMVGRNAGAANTAGATNTFIGNAAGLLNQNGNSNTVVGSGAFATNTAGGQNAVFGTGAGAASTGSNNTFLGTNAGQANANASNNVFVGFQSGQNNTTGQNNTYVGMMAAGTANLTNATALGYTATVTQSNSLVLGGTGANAVNVGIGNTAPASRLHVAVGSAGYAPNPTSALTVEANGNVYANVISGAGESGVLFGSAANAANGGVLYNSGFTPNGMQLRTGGNIPRLSISATGDVTIADNTSWPGYKFGVIASQPSAMAALQNQDPNGYSGFHFINNAGTARAHIGAGNATSPNWANMGYTGTYSAHPFVLTTSDIERVRIDATGNVGIGTTAPTALLEVNGFSKLGSNAPAVKMLKLTGTTAATEGAFVAIPHGLNAAKILAINVQVESVTNVNWIPPQFTYLPGYLYSYILNFSNVVIYNIAGQSAAILGKPVKILITYEQ